jgi:hypothetical protein
MRETVTSIALRGAAIAVALALALAACGTIGGKSTQGASSDKEARYVKPSDPLARPIQVGWTSARATHCGFIFSPEQLRANYLVAETQSGVSPEQMKKIERAYDYTRQSTLDSMQHNPGYCNADRTAAIRRDLNRYLAGDYQPAARLAR